MKIVVDWISRLGGRDDNEASAGVARSIAVDGLGSVYIAGVTSGALGRLENGDVGGRGDAWLAKYDGQTGHRWWLKRLGSTHYDAAWGIAADDLGYVYLSGETRGGLGQLETGDHGGDKDAWLAKYDGQSGQRLWLKRLGSAIDPKTAGAETSHGLAIDKAGGVYMTGETFGPLGRLEAGDRAGHGDAWIAKYEAETGRRLWIKRLGSVTDSDEAGYEVANDIAADGIGGVFITGETSGNLGQLEQGDNGGRGDAWLAKYDAASGRRLWIKRLGSESYDTAWDLAADSAGDVYLAGETSGELGQLEKGDAGGNKDAWLAKYHGQTGQRVWIKRLGSKTETGATSYDIAYGVAVDGLGGVYVAGETSGILGPLEASEAGGQGDAWVARYDSQTGERSWVRRLGTINPDTAWDIAADSLGNIYLTGETMGELGELAAGEQAGVEDAWLAKLHQEVEPSPEAIGSQTQQMLLSQKQLMTEVANLRRQVQALQEFVNSESLVGWWLLQEVDKTMLLDSSRSNAPAKLSGSATFESRGQRPALQFDGQTYATILHHPPFALADQLSLTAWVKPGRVATQIILMKPQAFALFLDDKGVVSVIFNDDQTLRVNSTARYPANGKSWLHLAATFDGATVTLYLNGQAASQEPLAFKITANDRAITLGADFAGKHKLVGALSDVRIYRRALSAVEVSVLAQAE